MCSLAHVMHVLHHVTILNGWCGGSIGRVLDFHSGVLGSILGQALKGSKEGPLCGMYPTVGWSTVWHATSMSSE